MPRLKNRSSQVPDGLTYLEAATGWKPTPWSSFDSIVAQLIAHRRGNPHLTLKYRLPIDQATVENQVDEYNAVMCQKRGLFDYIQNESVPIPKWTPPSSWSERAHAAGASVRRTVAGIKIFTDWLGPTLKPVDPALAEKRAVVCAVCQKNQDPNWIQKFNAVAANQIKTLIEIKHDLELRTSLDDKLHSCQVCDCPLVTKVHEPLSHIIQRTNQPTMAALKEVQPPCWIVTETP